MNMTTRNGVTLIELLVAMAIASLVGTMIMQMVISFQSRVLIEISRNDLQDRAERLIRFLASDIREAAFLLGPEPKGADGAPIALVHDSLSGDPPELLPYSILPVDSEVDDDRLTFVKAVSFAPALILVQPASAGESLLTLNRRPNHSPGSTRELLPNPEAINHLVLDNHRISYAVDSPDLTLQLSQPLATDAPAGTEVLGVRAFNYRLEAFAGSNRLRRDDFTAREILDDLVDGLQFEYLLDDGTMVSTPANLTDVHGIRISLLIRDQRPDRGYLDETIYTLGNRSYGPFRDQYRRYQVSQLVEVKNHVLQ